MATQLAPRMLAADFTGGHATTAVLANVASLKAGVIACRKPLLADFLAFTVGGEALPLGRLVPTGSTGPRTGMSALKYCWARCRTQKLCWASISGACNRDNVLAAGNFFLYNCIAMDRSERLSQVAEDVILDMTTGKLDAMHFDATLATGLSAGVLLTRVVARLMRSLARLRACKDSMHGLRVTSGLAHVAAVGQSPLAAQATTTFRAELRKVIRLHHVADSVGMARAAYSQWVAHWVYGSKHLDDFLPHWNVRIRVGVSDKIHSMLGATKKDVDSVGRFQKPDSLLFVASDQRHDDDFRFLALKVVDSSDAKKFTQRSLL
jgi:hypothetical protein